jgi:hypothetical protein
MEKAVKLLVQTRTELIGQAASDNDAALLLEGSWPVDTPSVRQRSLDEAIDTRFDWIDLKATQLAEQLDRHTAASSIHPLDGVSAAYLNALGLRYYLVKLLRPVVYFTDVRPLKPGDSIELVADGEGDDDYAALLGELCREAGAEFSVDMVRGKEHTPHRFPPNAPWRRWAARVCRLAWRPHSSRGQRVVLCGNPRLLQPVCDELLDRGCSVYWLCDRFAVKQWFRRGVEQLVCNSSLGRSNGVRVDVPERFEFRGINLAEPLRRWFDRRLALHGPRQTRMVEQIEGHFRSVRPDAIVLDEDATPFARAAVAMAGRHGSRSFVIQHGAPCCRFGFSPLAADAILAWGDSSRRKLIDWGVPPQRIHITGSPQHEGLRNGKRNLSCNAPAMDGPRILLLATTPPRDNRPDAMALQLTTDSYRQMLRTAFSTIAGIDGVRLTVKLHPRTPEDPLLRRTLAEFPTLDARLIRRGRLDKLLEDADCVLSCGSSAGVEAAALGLPVIQLEPARAANILPHADWGMIGSARNKRQLQELLIRVLLEGQRADPRRTAGVFANVDRSATAEVVNRVLGLSKTATASDKLTAESKPDRVHSR